MNAAESVARTINLEQQGLTALASALPNGLADAFAKAAAIIGAATGTVIVSGMGKSGHVGRKIAATLASTRNAEPFRASAEASHGDLGVIRQTDVVLALSWSGETAELADIVAYTGGSRCLWWRSRHARRRHSGQRRMCASRCRKPGGVPERPGANHIHHDATGGGRRTGGSAAGTARLSAGDFGRFHPGGKLGAQLLQVSTLMHTGDALPTIAEDAMLAEGIVEMTSKRFGIAGVVDTAETWWAH